MKCTNADVSCLTLAAVAAMAMATLESAATAGGGDKDRDISTRAFVISGDGPSATTEAHTFEITVEGGEVTVTIDGEDLPAHRFRFEDGEVVILDEDGNELKSFDVVLGGGDDVHMMWAGDEPFVDIRTVYPQGVPNVLVGVHLDDPDEALLYHLRLDKGQATMISGLYKGLPAHKAGLDRYDIIVAVDGQQPADPKSILEVLADKEPGDDVKFTVIHQGRTTEFSVTLEAFDAARMDPSQLIGGSGFSSRIFMPGEGEIEIMPGLPGVKGWEFFVDPEKGERFRRLEQFKLPEGFHEELREQLQQRIPGDLDERMEGLNERLQEMQEMINRLVEQARELAEEAEENEGF
ncbi:MAG: PDZ domain-containing protein [Planctomycetota bacterium]|jgi:hypothetical protein